MWPEISIFSSYYSISTPEGGSNLNTVTSSGGQTWIAQTCEGPHHEFNSSFLQHASGKGIECDYTEKWQICTEKVGKTNKKMHSRRNV